MTANRTMWIAVLVVALAALGSSIAWAATRADDDGWGMMSYGSGMMGYASQGDGEPVRDLRQARDQAQRFADRMDLRVGEVMQFDEGYYAELDERDGRPATEVLIDAGSGAVWFEYGPAMMWNTRYGMMRGGGPGQGMGSGMMGWMMGAGDTPGRGGMMGVGPADQTWTPSDVTGVEPQVTGPEARRIAQRWLDENRSGLRATEVTAFPGYHTLHVERDGRIAGMLSVNAYTGAVWYHWWHGRFVGMEE